MEIKNHFALQPKIAAGKKGNFWTWMAEREWMFMEQKRECSRGNEQNNWRNNGWIFFGAKKKLKYGSLWWLVDSYLAVVLLVPASFLHAA